MLDLNKNKIGIFILAYNRVDHLKKVIKPLIKYTKQNDIIHIFSDNSNTNSLEVAKVRDYLKTLNSKKFKLVFRKKNLGLKLNWLKAYDYMFSIYDRVICLEDDTIIKKNFLYFMQENLIKFANDKRIMSITGYAFPTKLPENYNYNIYFTDRSNSWGQASWARVWKLFKKNKENNLDILLNKKNLNLLKKGGNDIVHMFIHDYLKYINSMQIWWTWNILKNGGLCINPVNSMLKNIGFDGSGTHYNKSVKSSKTIEIKKKKLKKLNSLLYRDVISKNFNDQFEISNKLKIIYNIFPMFFVICVYKFANHMNFFFKK
tara:strand:- start:536 stop:1486 length:951 start_codon:yes stop_codon:yes gene_type:complete